MSLTLCGQGSKDLVESKRLPWIFPIFWWYHNCDGSIFYSRNTAWGTYFSRMERSHSTINSDISWWQEKKRLFRMLRWIVNEEKKRLWREAIPLRSCIWLYSLRFSSTTLWYPEAAWETIRKWLPNTTQNDDKHQMFGRKKFKITDVQSLYTKLCKVFRALQFELFYPRLNSWNITFQILQ